VTDKTALAASHRALAAIQFYFEEPKTATCFDTFADGRSADGSGAMNEERVQVDTISARAGGATPALRFCQCDGTLSRERLL